MSTMPIRWDALSEEARVVLRELVDHRGRAEAVPVPEIADITGLSPRRCQQVVKSLIEDHGIPIGSSSSAGRPGWYLCDTADELAANREALIRRAKSILVRARAFRPSKSALTRQLVGQLELQFDRRA